MAPFTSITFRYPLQANSSAVSILEIWFVVSALALKRGLRANGLIHQIKLDRSLGGWAMNPIAGWSRHDDATPIASLPMPA